MARILVTGGSGFIGSHTCLLLLEKGHELFIVDSYINSSKLAIENICKILEKKNINFNNKLHIFDLDLRNINEIESLFKKVSESGKTIDGVIHFAGLKSVSDSILFPLDYWDANVKSTINLLKVMDFFRCRTIIFSSSATIYRPVNNQLISENNLIDPINPYGETKVVIEKILKNIFVNSSEKWKIMNLRYFNPIGAHDSGLIGESPKGKPNNIFPLIIATAIGQIKEFKIFGKSWPTKDGTPIRDYIHVMDVADAHISAFEFLRKNQAQFLNINLGTGKGTSVLELIKVFEKINSVSIPYRFVENRNGDSGYLVADNSLATKLLNWQPSKSLQDMCKDGWIWAKNYPNGFKKI